MKWGFCCSPYLLAEISDKKLLECNVKVNLRSSYFFATLPSKEDSDFYSAISFRGLASYTNFSYSPFASVYYGYSIDDFFMKGESPLFFFSVEFIWGSSLIFNLEVFCKRLEFILIMLFVSLSLSILFNLCYVKALTLAVDKTLLALEYSEPRLL